MNYKNENNIGTNSKYLNSNNTDVFLKEQLNLYREIRKGEKTWKDMDALRQQYGFPSVNTDSLRRSFGSFGAYDDAGWISQVNSNSVAATNRETIETNFKTGTTVSDKVISLLPEEINSADILLQAHGFNPKEFELISARNSKWEQGSKEGIKTLYSSKIAVKPRTDIIPYLSDICKEIFSFTPPARIKKSSSLISKSNEVLVMPLYDFHWGRLPDMEHAEKYSLEQTKELLIDNMLEYINRFKNRKFDKIYLVVGQDYFNSCFTGYTTSQSHLQSNAVDVRTMYTTGTELLIEIINMFANICNNVHVVGSIGNHDSSEEIWLFNLLKAYYRNENIQVDDSPKPRKYLDIGASCVGLGHLDKERERVFGLMQCEAPELWAKSNTRMFIAGHLHHLTVESKQGVELWRIPSPTMPDRWTVENGYVQDLPRTMAFIFDYDKGLTENHFVNI